MFVAAALTKEDRLLRRETVLAGREARGFGEGMPKPGLEDPDRLLEGKATIER